MSRSRDHGPDAHFLSGRSSSGRFLFGTAGGGFGGAVVAQFEARQSDSMESLVRRHGGVPWRAPALSEVPVVSGYAEADAIRRLAVGGFDLVVLLTGVGARRLIGEAERLGLRESVEHALSRAATVCRGPKPAFALKQIGLRAAHLVPEPHTTAQLLETLDSLALSGRDVFVVSAGETMPEPRAFLESRGARAVEIQLYRWALDAADAARLDHTIDELIAGRIDAVAVTTQVQVRHLFDVAVRGGKEDALANALRDRTLVGAVGLTCANALRERGVEPDVIPEHPKMGHLVVAMARAVAAGAPAQSADDPGDSIPHTPAERAGSSR